MEYHGHLVAGIADGLIHPHIGIAHLAPLDLQVQFFLGANDIGRFLPARELLAPPSRTAHDPSPFLAGFQFATFALGA
jgi:hypothetical protein